MSKKATSKKTKNEEAGVALERTTAEVLRPDFSNLPRGEGGRFQKGFNPHAHGIVPYNTHPNQGRRLVLDIFDRVIAEKGHMEMLEIELRAFIAKHGMLAFYQQYIFPLLPKEMICKAFGGDGSDARMLLSFEIAQPPSTSGAATG